MSAREPDSSTSSPMAFEAQRPGKVWLRLTAAPRPCSAGAGCCTCCWPCSWCWASKPRPRATAPASQVSSGAAVEQQHHLPAVCLLPSARRQNTHLRCSSHEQTRRVAHASSAHEGLLALRHGVVPQQQQRPCLWQQRPTARLHARSWEEAAALDRAKEQAHRCPSVCNQRCPPRDPPVPTAPCLLPSLLAPCPWRAWSSRRRSWPPSSAGRGLAAGPAA